MCGWARGPVPILRSMYLIAYRVLGMPTTLGMLEGRVVPAVWWVVVDVVLGLGVGVVVWVRAGTVRAASRSEGASFIFVLW